MPAFFTPALQFCPYALHLLTGPRLAEVAKEDNLVLWPLCRLLLAPSCSTEIDLNGLVDLEVVAPDSTGDGKADGVNRGDVMPDETSGLFL